MATSIRQVVERMFAANRSFFQLMLGFLALGLLVCLTGLGVVMVRAVRERRRTIGVLRALGFRTGTIHRSFMLESSFIAFEGILLGVGLSVLTSWLLFTNSSAFKGLEGGFIIDWRTISLLVVSTFVDSLLVDAPWLTLGRYEEVCRASDDALDAVIAALTARAAALGRVTVPPGPQAAAIASREGWIALPTCTLKELEP